MFKEFVHKNLNGEELIGNSWLTDKEVKGNFCIAHGMAEYSLRYDDFAKYLNSLGYNVYMIDHIGHGKNAKEGLGVWPENGFDVCVDNFYSLINSFEKEKVPTIVMGHSMGSFITQALIERYNFKNVAKVILCGSSGPQFVHKLAPTLCKIVTLGKDGKEKSPLMDRIAFSSYCNKIENKRTNFDWLSVNEENVDKYIADEGCGYICSINFYKSFFSSLKKLHTKENLSKINKATPILIIAGEEDPVGGYGKAVVKLHQIYDKYDINNKMILYPKLRHEILNEKEKDKVYQDIANFIG